MATETTAGRGFTVRPAAALFVASNADVAVIVAVPAATPSTCPVAETVATVGADDVQFTALDAPFTTDTVAVNCVCSPTVTVAEAGEIVTAVTRGVVSGGGPDDSLPPPHEAITRAVAAAANR